MGCICKCGAPIWLWDTEMDTEEELAELREWKREDDWTLKVVHSPHGCGERMVVDADGLILLENRHIETEPAHRKPGEFDRAPRFHRQADAS